MQKFVAVIGNRNSGKSTVIKSLTGCPRSTFRGKVRDGTTGNTIHVVCNSPQEAKLSLAEFRRRVRASVRDQNSRGFVLAIQPTRPNVRLSLEAIFQEVMAMGAFELHAFVLDPGYKGSASIAADVKNRLKGFPIKRTVLDGQRFAHINTQIINRRTRIAS